MVPGLPTTENNTTTVLPTTPFRVPIIRKKKIDSLDSDKKEMLVIPSIKFASFLTYVYKIFNLPNPPTLSLLYHFQ